MPSLDLSTNLLWQTLSRDVYSHSRKDSKSADLPESIREIDESLSASQPLLQGRSEKPTNKGSGWLITSFLIVNTALGIGILNFPAAFDQAGGIFYATIIQIIMMALMFSTMLILAHCSDARGDVTYHGVLLSMCGHRGQQLAAFSITLTLYCVCVASLIVIGDQMDNLLHSLVGSDFCHKWYLNRQFTICFMSICFILPACFCKRVDFLSYIGSIGIFAMLYPVFLTVYGYFKLTPNSVVIKTRPDSLSGMFAMLPVLGLGYQCQEVVVPVYACMRERTLPQFIKSSILSMLVLFVIYSVIGCFGYLTFGSNVAHNVMKMYDAKDGFVVVGVAALIVKMIATYPILALCGRDAVGGLYAELVGLKPSEFESTERGRRYTVATLWFFSSLILAVITDSIGVVIKYLGSVASVNIFVYPGICLLQLVLKEDPGCLKIRSKVLAAYAIFVAGVGAFCFGVVLLEAILDSSTDPPMNLCSSNITVITYTYTSTNQSMNN